MYLISTQLSTTFRLSVKGKSFNAPRVRSSLLRSLLESLAARAIEQKARRSVENDKRASARSHAFLSVVRDLIAVRVVAVCVIACVVGYLRAVALTLLTVSFALIFWTSLGRPLGDSSRRRDLLLDAWLPDTFPCL